MLGNHTIRRISFTVVFGLLIVCRLGLTIYENKQNSLSEEQASFVCVFCEKQCGNKLRAAVVSPS